MEEASQQQIRKCNFIILLCQVWDGGGEGVEGWRGEIHSKEMKWRQTREAIRCH